VNVVSIKTMGMWHIMLCSLLGRYQCFGEVCIGGVWCEDGSSKLLQYIGTNLLNYITPYHRTPVMSVHGPLWQCKLL